MRFFNEVKKFVQLGCGNSEKTEKKQILPHHYKLIQIEKNDKNYRFFLTDLKSISYFLT